MNGKRLLIARMWENDITRKELADELGIRVETFNIKLKTGTWKCSEAKRIAEILFLSNDDIVNIFFV